MSRYLDAKEMYAKIGVDTDKAIETLKSVPVALSTFQLALMYATASAIS